MLEFARHYKYLGLRWQMFTERDHCKLQHIHCEIVAWQHHLGVEAGYETNAKWPIMHACLKLISASDHVQDYQLYGVLWSLLECGQPWR